MVERRIASVPDALETLRAAAAEDVTAALRALDSVNKSFSAAIDDLTHRTGMIEQATAEAERAAPLLRLIEEPPPQGLRITRFRARRFLILTIALCLLAAAAGFLAGRRAGG